MHQRACIPLGCTIISAISQRGPCVIVSPEVIVAHLPAGCTAAAAAGGAGNEAQVVRVAALVATLTHALDKVVADGICAAFGLGAVENLRDGRPQGRGGDARMGGRSLLSERLGIRRNGN